MTKLKNTVRYIPLWSRIVLCLFPAAILLHISFIISKSFAEFYSLTVGHFFRTLLAYLTNLFPMSVAEAVIIYVPFIFVSLIIFVIRMDEDNAAFVKLVSGLLSVITLVYTIFTVTFAAGFYVRDIGEYFGIERREISLDELCEATAITVSELNEIYPQLEGRGMTSTTMGMDYDELNATLLVSFDDLHGEYAHPPKMTSRIKPVVLSEPMTYTHISGVYTFFTGEANINVNYPDFVIPYTAAHELSHQRGVSREDEANFVAFLVCVGSDDPYVQYSGYLNMFQYMSSALASVSYEKYAEICAELDEGIIKELASYSEFFDKYRDNIAADVSDTVNDSYLSVMSGTDSRSYGMVVDLASLYLLGYGVGVNP